MLHKLEGDFCNAKMRYTDLGNANAEAGNEDDRGTEDAGPDRAPTFRRFHEFWFVPASNGGKGSRKNSKDRDLVACDDLPHSLQLTAHGHTDLVFLASLAVKAASSKAISDESVKDELEKHHSATTLAEDKIKLSRSAFGLDELQQLYDQLAQTRSSQDTVRGLTQLELVWMLGAMVQDFGWREYTMADTVEGAGTRVDSRSTECR